MAATLVKVNPGDPISSEQFNLMIDMLNALSGSTGPISIPVAITGVVPPAAHVGDALQVFGSGLAAANLQEITVDTTNVPIGFLKTGSTDSVAIFDVPPVLVPPGGKSATLVMKNRTGASASSPLFLLPQVVPDLNASFNIVRTQVLPAGNLAAGTAYEFTFSIETFSTLDETYLLDPKILGAPAGWTAVMKGAATELFIPKSQPTPTTSPVIVVVTTGAIGGGTLSLGIKAKNHPSIAASSMGEGIAIGSTPGVPNVAVEFFSPTVLGSVQKFANGSLYIRTNGNPALQMAVVNPLNVRLQTGGQYTVGAPVVSNPSWTVTVNSNPNINTTGMTNAIIPLIFTVTAQALAPDANVQIPVTGLGPLPDGTFTCQLKLRADPSNPVPL